MSFRAVNETEMTDNIKQCPPLVKMLTVAKGVIE